MRFWTVLSFALAGACLTGVGCHAAHLPPRPSRAERAAIRPAALP